MGILKRIYRSIRLAREIRREVQMAYEPAERIRELRDTRARDIVEYAYRYVPWYTECMKEKGIIPPDIHTADDLEILPTVARREVQKNPLAFVSTERPVTEYLALRTGGSTGEPKTIYHDVESLFMVAAHGERGRRIVTDTIGKRYGYKETILVPRISSTSRISEFWKKNAWFPPWLQIKRQWLSLFEQQDVNVKKINQFKPDTIFTYGSHLDWLFSFLETENVKCYMPKAIIYSSDTLSESTRSLIQDKYCIPLFSWYQTVEAAKVGFECEEHNGIHLNEDWNHIRIVDDEGNTLPPGEEGEIVISNLHNHGTVLLNYKIGDVGTMYNERCPCGRTLKLMSFPGGRVDDFLITKTGRTVHPQEVTNIMTELEDLWQFQIRQFAPSSFKIELVIGNNGDPDTVKKDIQTLFFHTFGNDIVIQWDFVDSITPTDMGKRRRVICKIDKS
jgi:phenylacetate-CoA ligase